ncbi:uncharacterized protein FIBRA_01392 [Fibroporia radiculosa]|uniref:Peroxin-3 n=1 Tax=Fibroporia radiculosa TaxID=599839 RepID=J4H134_9APHY|nr:uncharacterized protein FIBRA_01392 [Fibroporia radiculosa]CCL99374.1 predicted protein [Fibroporia radiculosa]
MLHSVANYFHKRREGLQRAAGYFGGAYLLGQYVLGRLEDVRMKVMQDRLAQENLRRRFEQNQQDVSFTIMALLPTLSRHILEGMDVEGVTNELQAFSKASKTPNGQAESQPSAPPSHASIIPSIELSSPSQDGHMENGSVSFISSVQDNDASPTMSASTTSWTDPFPDLSRKPSTIGSDSEIISSLSSSQHHVEWSGSTLSASSSSSAVADNCKTSPPESIASETSSSMTRSKAELWKEVKMLTFTRTLTIIYSVTLLSLFTHIQLNLLGRSKYIHSVIQAEREERRREKRQYDLETLSFLREDEDLQEEPEEGTKDLEAVDEDTERKYLTLSWWILHVGWKDVGERVRRGVEEVFEGVSLKTKFSVGDLFRLVNDVRRRVEYEVTFEGQERRINFMSTLLPPTIETLQHVLVQGGIPTRVASATDAQFESLLTETRTHIFSASFQRVLEVCLDQATDMLFSGLRKNIFSGETIGCGVDGDDQEVRERLAAMLPGLGRWCHLALETYPNELVDGLAGLRDMEALSAIIYSSYDDRFR